MNKKIYKKIFFNNQNYKKFLIVLFFFFFVPLVKVSASEESITSSESSELYIPSSNNTSNRETHVLADVFKKAREKEKLNNLNNPSGLYKPSEDKTPLNRETNVLADVFKKAREKEKQNNLNNPSGLYKPSEDKTSLNRETNVLADVFKKAREKEKQNSSSELYKPSEDKTPLNRKTNVLVDVFKQARTKEKQNSSSGLYIPPEDTTPLNRKNLVNELYKKQRKNCELEEKAYKKTYGYMDYNYWEKDKLFEKFKEIFKFEQKRFDEFKVKSKFWDKLKDKFEKFKITQNIPLSDGIKEGLIKELEEEFEKNLDLDNDFKNQFENYFKKNFEKIYNKVSNNKNNASEKELTAKKLYQEIRNKNAHQENHNNNEEHLIPYEFNISPKIPRNPSDYKLEEYEIQDDVVVRNEEALKRSQMFSYSLEQRNQQFIIDLYNLTFNLYKDQNLKYDYITRHYNEKDLIPKDAILKDSIQEKFLASIKSIHDVEKKNFDIITSKIIEDIKIEAAKHEQKLEQNELEDCFQLPGDENFEENVEYFDNNENMELNFEKYIDYQHNPITLRTKLIETSKNNFENNIKKFASNYKIQLKNLLAIKKLCNKINFLIRISNKTDEESQSKWDAFKNLFQQRIKEEIEIIKPILPKQEEILNKHLDFLDKELKRQKEAIHQKHRNNPSYFFKYSETKEIEILTKDIETIKQQIIQIYKEFKTTIVYKIKNLEFIHKLVQEAPHNSIYNEFNLFVKEYFKNILDLRKQLRENETKIEFLYQEKTNSNIAFLKEIDELMPESKLDNLNKDYLEKQDLYSKQTAKEYQNKFKEIFEKHKNNVKTIRKDIEEKNKFLEKEKKDILLKQKLKNQVLINKNINFYQKISGQEEELLNIEEEISNLTKEMPNLTQSEVPKLLAYKDKIKKLNQLMKVEYSDNFFQESIDNEKNYLTNDIKSIKREQEDILKKQQEKLKQQKEFIQNLKQEILLSLAEDIEKTKTKLNKEIKFLDEKEKNLEFIQETSHQIQEQLQEEHQKVSSSITATSNQIQEEHQKVSSSITATSNQIQEQLQEQLQEEHKKVLLSITETFNQIEKQLKEEQQEIETQQIEVSKQIEENQKLQEPLQTKQKELETKQIQLKAAQEEVSRKEQENKQLQEKLREEQEKELNTIQKEVSTQIKESKKIPFAQQIENISVDEQIYKKIITKLTEDDQILIKETKNKICHNDETFNIKFINYFINLIKAKQEQKINSFRRFTTAKLFHENDKLKNIKIEIKNLIEQLKNNTNFLNTQSQLENKIQELETVKTHLQTEFQSSNINAYEECNQQTQEQIGQLIKNLQTYKENQHNEQNNLSDFFTKLDENYNSISSIIDNKLAYNNRIKTEIENKINQIQNNQINPIKTEIEQIKKQIDKINNTSNNQISQDTINSIKSDIKNSFDNILNYDTEIKGQIQNIKNEITTFQTNTKPNIDHILQQMSVLQTQIKNLLNQKKTNINDQLDKPDKSDPKLKNLGLIEQSFQKENNFLKASIIEPFQTNISDSFNVKNRLTNETCNTDFICDENKFLKDSSYDELKDLFNTDPSLFFNSSLFKTALHEVGHTLVCLYHIRTIIHDKEQIQNIIEKVTINSQDCNDDTKGYLQRKLSFENQSTELKIALGGLAAEMLFYEDKYCQGKEWAVNENGFYKMSKKYIESEEYKKIAKGCGSDFKQTREILKKIEDSNTNLHKEFRQYTSESEKIISYNIQIVKKIFDRLIKSEQKRITTDNEADLNFFKECYEGIKIIDNI